MNGQLKIVNDHPMIKHGRTLLPVRSIFEELGSTVEWDQSTQTVTIVNGDTTLTLKVNSKVAMKNNAKMELEADPEVVKGKTMIPLRFIAEALGAEVKWDSKTNNIYITTK
ncbi:copper amine oxidase N-terminal domain-containing protein [Bacillus taeanensis]|uniref:copper amine oxidase N-terminal domain-containing protein n=1 Tax=Bacillus taeanensis TaxID=273032 RepID=UPI003CCC66F1